MRDERVDGAARRAARSEHQISAGLAGRAGLFVRDHGGRFMLRAVPDVPEPDVLKRVHSVGPQANLHVRLSVPESRLCAVRKRASAARERSWDSERASRGRGRRESERVARKAFSSFARRARFVFVRRVEKKSRLHRVPIDKDDAATPRANPRGPDPGRRAGLRGAFRARNKGDVPGDHSSLAICRLVYSVVPLGTAPAWKGRIVSRTVGRHVGDGASARARWGTHRKADTPARVSPAPRPSSGELRSTATPS
mgnify:CR=1 FL=1